MKYNVKRVIAVVAMLVMVLGASAQALRTGYFLDGNLFRYRLNPALSGERGYFSLPVLGGININSTGNFGLSNFLYESPYNSNELVTFMHSSVSADEFLGNLESDNVMSMNLDFTLLSAGFKAFGGYNTVDVTLRSQTGMSLPYDMLRFMKVMGDNNYSFGDINMRTRNFVDLSLGHSRKINESLTVGARAKFLLGLAYADVKFDQMNLSMNRNRWEIAARGEANIALGGAFAYSDEKTASGKTVVNGYEDISAGLQGFGMGLDLGATYDFSELLTPGLVVSASLTDLGYVNWNKTAQASIAPEDSYVFDGFSQMGIHNDSENASIEDQWETTRDELEDFFALEDKGEGSVKSGLGAKLNLGVEYSMPFYDKLSAGLLYTHCFDDVFSYNQTSLMVSVSPLKILDFAVSGTFSDYGTGFGAMANLHCTGFSFFVGTDCFIGKVGKQYIPLENMNASVSFGVNIAFGK